jgi:hypothetical protein
MREKLKWVLVVGTLAALAPVLIVLAAITGAMGTETRLGRGLDQLGHRIGRWVMRLFVDDEED